MISSLLFVLFNGSQVTEPQSQKEENNSKPCENIPGTKAYVGIGQNVFITKVYFMA